METLRLMNFIGISLRILEQYKLSVFHQFQEIGVSCQHLMMIYGTNISCQHLLNSLKNMEEIIQINPKNL